MKAHAFLALFIVLIISMLMTSWVVRADDSVYHHLAQAKQYRMVNLKLSEQHAREALELAHATGTDTLILDAKQSLGICFLAQHRNEEAIEIFKKIVTEAGNMGDLYRESRADANISIALNQLGKSEELLKLQDEILIKLQHSDFNLLKTAALIHKARAYTHFQQYDSALICYNHALEIARRITPDDPSGHIVSLDTEKHIADIELNMVNTLIIANRTDSALVRLNRIEGECFYAERLCAAVKCHVLNGEAGEAINMIDRIAALMHQYDTPTGHWHLNSHILNNYAQKEHKANELMREKERYKVFVIALLGLILIISVLYIIRQRREIRQKHAILVRKLKEEVAKESGDKHRAEVQSYSVRKDLLPKLQKAIEEQFYLKKETATVEKLAEKIGTNRNDLHKLIKAEYGITPKEWINNLICEEAKRLISLNPQISQTELAEKLNMERKTLNTNFKKREDLTPYEYAKMFR